MSLTPAHGGDKTPAAGDSNGNGDASIRQRVGSLAAVNAESLSQQSSRAPTVKPAAAGASSQQLPIHPRRSSGAAPDLDPYSASHIYYGASHNKRNVAKARTYSAVGPLPCHVLMFLPLTACRSTPVLAPTLPNRWRKQPSAA
jgi:alpha,alpha-trehalase